MLEMIGIIAAALILLFGFTAFTGAPFVPSKRADVRDAFKTAYPLGKDDLLIDLGSGNGAVIRIAAEEFGARAVGVELNPLLALASKVRFRKNDRIRIVCRDLFRWRFPDETTVIYVFGDDRDLKKIAEKVKSEASRLGRPLFLVSYAFEFRDLKKTGRSGMHFCYRIEPD